MRLCFALLAGTLSFLAVPATLADLVIYDGFDYTLGAPLNGQESPDVGWGGPWGVDAPITSDVIVPGLTFPGPQYRLVVSGNAAQLTTATLVDSCAARITPVDLHSGELWTSWLVYIDGPLDGLRVVETRVNSFQYENYLSAKYRTIAKEYNFTVPGVAYDFAETVAVSPNSTQAGTTYLIVSHFEDLETDVGGPATLWLISPADFAAMDLAGGVMSVAELDAHHTVKVSDGHANRGLFAGDWVQMTLYGDIGATFDELRYGTGLSDVVPLELVNAPIITGDIDCNGTYGESSFGDINPFIQYLSDFPTWQATYPGCDPRAGDMNCDGTYGALSFGDINPFVQYLSDFAAWQAAYPGCLFQSSADNADGRVELTSPGDLKPFVTRLEQSR